MNAKQNHLTQPDHSASDDHGAGFDPRGMPKKPYAKPALLKIPLRPEEAVLGNCKTDGFSGPSDSNCGPIACVTLGS